MSGKCFVDTNVIVYAHTDHDLHKQETAQKIISLENTIISTQVLQESANILFKKFHFAWPDIQTILKEAASNNYLHTNADITIDSACRVAERYGFSFYDSLIVAAALESGCERLFSEDLQSGQVIDGVLIIENPFTI